MSTKPASRADKYFAAKRKAKALRVTRKAKAARK